MMYEILYENDVDEFRAAVVAESEILARRKVLANAGPVRVKHARLVPEHGKKLFAVTIKTESWDWQFQETHLAFYTEVPQRSRYDFDFNFGQLVVIPGVTAWEHFRDIYGEDLVSVDVLEVDDFKVIDRTWFVR